MPRANYLEKQVALFINYIFAESPNARNARQKFRTFLSLNSIFRLSNSLRILPRLTRRSAINLVVPTANW